jgi:hypothetical protein
VITTTILALYSTSLSLKTARWLRKVSSKVMLGFASYKKHHILVSRNTAKFWSIESVQFTLSGGVVIKHRPLQLSHLKAEAGGWNISLYAARAATQMQDGLPRCRMACQGSWVSTLSSLHAVLATFIRSAVVEYLYCVFLHTTENAGIPA